MTAGRYNPGERAANRNLLDEGTLCVDEFTEEGKVRWLPGVHGLGPLTAASGLGNQAEVLIDSRRAAALLGATPMDRPVNVDPNPVTGTVSILPTNNSNRAAADAQNPRQRVNAADPWARNSFGHVLAMVAPKVDSGFDNPATRSPDFKEGVPPRRGGDRQARRRCDRQLNSRGARDGSRARPPRRALRRPARNLGLPEMRTGEGHFFPYW